MSRISVVIPCRNGAAYLAQTIRSALNQRLPPAEILVIDDGSTDGSSEIAASFCAPVRVEGGPAEGAAHARNRGAEIASGERLMFLDADDLITPPTLAALSRALDAHGAPAIAICPWDRHEHEGFGWIAAPPTAALPRPGQDRLAAWLTGCWSPPCAILWDRRAYERSGGWRQDAGLDDDGNLMRRALARGMEVVDASDGLALYRRLPGEEASYSSRRLQPFGLRSRLNSLADTVGELEKAGSLAHYRAPLAEALRAILHDAKGEPDIAGQARQLIRRAGGTHRLDAIRARAASGLARLSAAARERRASPPGSAPAGQAHASPPTGRETPSALSPPRVSVIIPTYNRAELVERAVRSALGQTYGNLDVVVVDDGSTDDTGARLRAIGDPRLRVIWQENAGVAVARNRGIAEAAGAFISFLDSDDEWRSDKLRKQIEALSGAPRQVGICATGGEIVGDGRTPQQERSPAGRLFEQLLVENRLFLGVSCLFRREVFEAVGGFDPALPAIEDWDLLQRAARLYDFVSIDEPLSIYNEEVRPDRRSRRFRANMDAREMLWRRNRHALRRAGLAHLYLLESARRELREAEGSSARGRLLVLRAHWERPQDGSLWRWLPYMMAPFTIRARLRKIDRRGRIGHLPA